MSAIVAITHEYFALDHSLYASTHRRRLLMLGESLNKNISIYFKRRVHKASEGFYVEFDFADEYKHPWYRM